MSRQGSTAPTGRVFLDRHRADGFTVFGFIKFVERQASKSLQEAYAKSIRLVQLCHSKARGYCPFRSI